MEKKTKKIIISLERQYPYEYGRYAIVGAPKDNSFVLRSAISWLKEDALDSIQAVAEEWIAEGYQISATSIKKYGLEV